MSPASQGGLQVERYIGTCLISKDYRYQDAHRAAHQGHQWAGLPLISMVQPRRHKQQQPAQQQPAQQPQQQLAQPQSPGGPRSPLSRLAIHTQGAPLILAGRYNNRKHGGGGAGLHNGLHGSPPAGAGGAGGAPPGSKGGPRSHRPLGPLPPPCGPMGPMGACKPSSDSLSIASDESSGHSENSLPRIIKPRKRRKKDRKPPQLAADTPTPTSAPTPPVPTVSLKSFGGEVREAVEHADEPKLHHDFDDVKEHDSTDEGVLLCQCRYCDPAGLIWDVDQNCYSPFLTPQPQPQHLSSFPLFISDSTRSFAEPQRPPANALGPVGARGPTDLLLRRSWSEPSPSRKLSESSDSQESDRRSPPSHQALGVSSEIVTSHNGHRDIEIKFFSLPSSAAELDCKQ